MSKPTELGSLKIGSYILLPVSDQPTGDPCRITDTIQVNQESMDQLKRE